MYINEQIRGLDFISLIKIYLKEKSCSGLKVNRILERVKIFNFQFRVGVQARELACTPARNCASRDPLAYPKKLPQCK